MKEIAAALVVEDGKILLFRDGEQWRAPGGEVEEDEAPTSAATGYVEEKIDADAELRKPLYSGEFEHEGEMYLWHGYLAETDEKPSIEDSDMEWFQPGELDDLELSPGIQMVLPALRRL